MQHDGVRSWSASRFVRSRRRRLALLGGGVAAWVALVIGILGGWDVLIVAGAAGTASAFAMATKLILEGRAGLARATAQRGADLLAGDVARRVDDLQRSADEINDRVTDATDQLAELAARLDRLSVTTETTRTGLTAARQLLDKVAVRTASRVIASRLASLSTTDVVDPLLSIAIPSFNRPAALAECLLSIEREVAALPGGLVEVCITDDVSTDPETLELAADYAERLPFASLRRQPSNVGLERNVLESCEPCRGEYVLIMGNDDKLVPGALDLVVDDLRRFEPSVYLFERHRIHADGSPHPPVAGTDPVDLPPGECQLFATLLEAVRRQGFVSTLGFTSHVIFRRLPFVGVDSSAYLDLTLYARVFVLIEAFASERLLYRNAPVVFHRTPSPAEKHVESVGRREEQFMAGGTARAARYFGTTLAAALQRLIDRGAVDASYVATLPERLLTTTTVVDWVAANRAIDPTVDERLDPLVVDDAERLFVALGGRSPPV